MLCPNCSTIFSGGKICPKCNMDAVLFTKTKKASLKLYNSGLAKAKEGNITGAIEDLKRCLVFDKTNNSARNLLGLCYYGIGEVSDALKHWIICSSYDAEDKMSKTYIDILNRNTRALDKYNDAIRQYNKAMEYMSQGSTDLAIIQLKKALDYNPYFVKALCLYALCCIDEKNYAVAMDCIDRALEIDSGCTLALRYRSEIMSLPAFKKGKIKGNEEEKEKKTDYPARAKSKKRYTPGGFDLIIFAAGAVAMAVILVTLVVPGWVESKDNKISSLEQKIAKLEEENENGSSVFGVKYAELEEENAKLKAENDKYKFEAANREAILAIKEANLLAEQGKYLEAGELLAGLDYANLNEEMKAQFDEASKEIYPVAAVDAVDSGIDAFDSGNISDAKKHFEFSYSADADGDKADDCLYYLGRIAEKTGDNAKAKDYYETLINIFPSSGYVGEAKNLVVGL